MLGHLDRLSAAILAGSDLVCRPIRPSSGLPVLRVTNPAAPELTEDIGVVAGAHLGDWHYQWPWGARIGPVDQVEETTRRIIDVLDPRTGSPETATLEENVQTLTVALTRRGLIAEPMRDGVWAKNPEADPPSTQGAALSPGLRQTVICRENGTDGRWWYWVWADPRWSETVEYEPLCPEGDVELAASRIGKVLGLRETVEGR
jgi:hypothetical protein